MALLGNPYEVTQDSGYSRSLVDILLDQFTLTAFRYRNGVGGSTRTARQFVPQTARNATVLTFFSTELNSGTALHTLEDAA